MRSARQRRLQPQQTKKVATQQPAVTSVQKQKSVTKPQVSKKQELKKMEEEEEDFENQSYESEDDSKEEDETLESQREDLRERVAPETLDELRPNGKLYIAIKDRYQELLKELWKSQSKLDEFGFSEDEKKILNDRVKIWLEYFAITSAFRDDNINLFEYIDSFTDTQKFI